LTPGLYGRYLSGLQEGLSTWYRVAQAERSPPQHPSAPACVCV